MEQVDFKESLLEMVTEEEQQNESESESTADSERSSIE